MAGADTQPFSHEIK